MATRNYFSFGEESSLDHFLTIEHAPDVRGGAEPDLAEYEIPGRDGTVFIDRGRRKNISVSYQTNLQVPEKWDIARYITDLKRWLLSFPGVYRRLEDTYDPDHFRKAVCAGGLDVDAEYRRFTKQKVKFYCLPYRYRKTGEQSMPLVSQAGQGSQLRGQFNNDTGFTANPVIVVQVSTGGTMTIFTEKMDDYPSAVTRPIQNCTIRFPSAGRYVIDCEKKAITDSTNGIIFSVGVIEEFPEIPPGRIVVGVNPDQNAGGLARIQSVYITPRWREL